MTEDATFASFDLSLHVDSGDVDASSGLSAERVIHVEHRKTPDGSWSSRTQFSSLPGSSVADRPSVSLDRSGMRVYSSDGRLLSAKRLTDLPMPSNIRRFAAENASQGPTLPPLLRPPAAARAPYLGSPIEQLVVRRSTARTRHEALEARLGVQPSRDGAALRYRARVQGASLEVASDSATGAILAETLRGDDGSVRETTHSYAALPAGDLVRRASRTALSVPGMPRKVVTTTIANLVIR
ncbi:MAG: hypothetical protein HYX65_06905 [Gemmatimonadetes bacterium]|nr:hypothetical protein [Gemmatimonadota bacterium]